MIARATAIAVALAACTPHPTEPIAKRVAIVDAAPSEAAPPGLRLPDGIEPLGYDLRLALDPDSARFRGEVTIRVRLATPASAVWLHAVGLDIASATFTVGGATAALAPVKATGDETRGWTFGRTLPAGEIALAFRYAGDVGTVEEGLFREKNLAGEWFLYSQSESVFARKILPCFDEPRWKVPWRVTLDVGSHLVAVANAAESSREPLDNGRVAVHFAETPPMPSYLLAVAVGGFTVIDGGTVGAQHVPFRIIIPTSDSSPKIPYVIDKTQRLVTELEAYFDSPLPWPKLDLLSVPHLFGAMENPGLITFDRVYLLDASTDRQSFIFVAGHELAHLWFGDWVTFAWWDDLWLAESLASWLGDKVAIASGGDAGGRRDGQLSRAFEADDDVDARPLRRAIANSHDPETAFDAIAYDKGQAVLAMFEHLAGAPTFRAAIRSYIDAHRGGLATSADLVAALAKESSAEVGDALTAVIDRPGASVLALACSGGALVGTMRGAPVPACVRVPGAKERCAVVGAAPHQFAATCPPWAIGNAGAVGYYHVALGPLDPPLRERTRDELVARGDDVVAALARGELASPAALAELDALAGKGSPGRLAAFAIASALDRFVDDARRPAWGAWLGARFAATFGATADTDERVREALLDLGMAPPAAIAKAGRAKLARDVAELGKHPSVDRMLVVLGPDLALGGSLDPHVLDGLRRALAKGTREVAFRALAHAPVALAGDLVAIALADPPEVAPVIALIERSATRATAWRALLPRVGELAAKLEPDDLVGLIETVGALCLPGSHAEVEAAFRPVVGIAPDGARTLDHALATIDRCVKRAATAGVNWP